MSAHFGDESVETQFRAFPNYSLSLPIQEKLYELFGNPGECQEASRPATRPATQPHSSLSLTHVLVRALVPRDCPGGFQDASGNSPPAPGALLGDRSNPPERPRTRTGELANMCAIYWPGVATGTISTFESPGPLRPFSWSSRLSLSSWDSSGWSLTPPGVTWDDQQQHQTMMRQAPDFELT